MLSNQPRRLLLLLLPMLLIVLTVAGWPLLRTAMLSVTDAAMMPVVDHFTVATPDAAFNLSELDITVDAVRLNNQVLAAEDYQVIDGILSLSPTMNAQSGDRVQVRYADRVVGLSNYTALLNDVRWWRSLGNTGLYAGAATLLSTLFGLLIAVLLNSRLRGRCLLQAAVLVPWVIPAVVAGRIWQWLYHDQFGLINQLLGTQMAWLADPALALWAIVLVDVWQSTPFIALLLVAALQLVPRDYYEAATVDGLSPWQQFRHITLPLIKPALLVAILFRLLDSVRVFDLIYVMAGHNSHTMSLSVYVHQQLIDFGQLGGGAASAMVLFLIIALVSGAYMLMTRLHSREAA